MTDLFSSGASSIVDSVGNAIDKIVTNDEEKLILRNALVKIEKDAKLKTEELAIEADKQITERWKIDSEHTVTRLVRPISFAWVIILFSVVMVGDSNFGFSIKEAYIPVLETLLVTMVAAYFGSRGIEKSIKISKGK
jgi:hypothetical protein